jgi:hypothetical protein
LLLGLTKIKNPPKEDYFCLNSKIESEIFQIKKKWQRPTSHAQPRTLAMFPSWESVGAGRVGLAGKYNLLYILQALCSVKITLYIGIFKIHTMKNYNVLSVILLAMALSNCGGGTKEKILYLISILHHFRQNTPLKKY